MCQGCWWRLGSPQVVNDRVGKAIQLVARVYQLNNVGGNLHVQLEDWNIDDGFFAGEFEPFMRRDDMEPGQFEAEQACFEFFKTLTLDERASALAAFEQASQGPWEPQPPAGNSIIPIVSGWYRLETLVDDTSLPDGLVWLNCFVLDDTSETPGEPAVCWGWCPHDDPEGTADEDWLEAKVKIEGPLPGYPPVEDMANCPVQHLH